MRWLERGDGDPVVLLHGVLGGMFDWDETLDELAPFWRALAPELPIYDAGVAAEPSPRAFAAVVLHWLDALGIRRAVLGGHSLGGLIAFEAALAAPERVAGLVLVAPAVLLPRGGTRRVPRVPTPAFVRSLVGAAAANDAAVSDAQLARLRAALADRTRARRLIQIARAVRRTGAAARVRRVAVPALIVCGAEDRVVPPAAAERLARRFRHADLVVVPGCGHALTAEAPERVNALVRGWLSVLRPRGAQPAAHG